MIELLQWYHWAALGVVAVITITVVYVWFIFNLLPSLSDVVEETLGLRVAMSIEFYITLPYVLWDMLYSKAILWWDGRIER